VPRFWIKSEDTAAEGIEMANIAISLDMSAKIANRFKPDEIS
jgi:hypothetical protein